jgi:hypothetical protein
MSKTTGWTRLRSRARPIARSGASSQPSVSAQIADQPLRVLGSSTTIPATAGQVARSASDSPRCVSDVRASGHGAPSSRCRIRLYQVKSAGCAGATAQPAGGTSGAVLGWASLMCMLAIT